MTKVAILSAVAVLLTACSNRPVQPPGEGHLNNAKVDVGGTAAIPATIQQGVVLPPPKPTAKVETYSVVVNNIKVQELLFALARDARINVDIHPGIEGAVTLNAIDQTLQQLLTRIAKQVDLRWEISGPNLAVMPDTPYLRTYTLDYVNISRDSTSSVAINTQIASTSTAASSATAAGNSGGNNSSTTVTSKAQNHFWESIEKNIKDILRETDKLLPEGSSETVTERADQQQTTGTGSTPAAGRNQSANQVSGSIATSPNPASLQQQGTTVVRRTTFREAASVILNAEAGVVVVRATSRQHEKVQEFLDLVSSSSRRQVMVEATIAEVLLKNDYEQGINWQSLRALRNSQSGFSTGMNSPGLEPYSTATFNSTQTINVPGGTQTATIVTNDQMGRFADPVADAGKAFLLNYIAPGLGIASTIKLLETFGNVKVLSSPKISVLNNQTAMLKVVNNIVYFTVKSDTTTTASGPGQTTVTTTPNSVSVGLVMSVTPQISENGNILLNVRPTISRVTAYKTDPNPSIPSTLINAVPEIQTREMESMLRLTDGEIAVMGGLMQETLNDSTDAVPLLSRLPGVGNFFTNRLDKREKTELVIFLKPTIIRDPSVQGDYRDFTRQLPNDQFFGNNPGPRQQQFNLPDKDSQ